MEILLPRRPVTPCPLAQHHRGFFIGVSKWAQVDYRIANIRCAPLVLTATPTPPRISEAAVILPWRKDTSHRPIFTPMRNDSNRSRNIYSAHDGRPHMVSTFSRVYFQHRWNIQGFWSGHRPYCMGHYVLFLKLRYGRGLSCGCASSYASSSSDYPRV